METRKEIAAEKKRCGSHNCTQAVVCTYYDYTGMDEETLRNVGNAFAAGMGNMEGTCGAIVGAGMVLRLATKDQAKSVKAMRQIMTQFQQRNGATQCKLLKGMGTGKILRECPLCVADAAELLEEQLDKLTDKYKAIATFVLWGMMGHRDNNIEIIVFRRITRRLPL